MLTAHCHPRAACAVVCAVVSVLAVAAASSCEGPVIVGTLIVPARADAAEAAEASVDADADAAAGDAGVDTSADSGADTGVDAGLDAGLDVGLDAGFCLQAIDDAGAVPDPDASVIVPWTTGFENGFCDYAPPLGFCYQGGVSSYSIVTSPVHSGHYAAAFSVRGDVDGGSQVRCVRQGVFPAMAYYGAWYYVQASATNHGLWNLVHFQGGVPGQKLHGLWDLSLSLTDAGMRATLFDFLNAVPPDAGTAPLLPIGQWVHLEVYFHRAKDATGEISMYQDGLLAVHVANLVTDDTDWGQWYVGNLADSLMPAQSTVYVDDVKIDFSP